MRLQAEGQRFDKISSLVSERSWIRVEMVIATNIWQKFSSIEREVTLIVMNFWQLFSRIFGETILTLTSTILDNAARSIQDGMMRADVLF